MKEMQFKNEKHPVVLFDGVCVLCSGAVRFIIRHDKKGRFRFAAMQSGAGRKMLDEISVPGDFSGTVVLAENGKYYFRSAAILRIFKKLSGLWPLLYLIIVIPGPVRDFFYKFVAGKRYSWFGRHDECMIPEESIKSRFIDQAGTGS